MLKIARDFEPPPERARSARKPCFAILFGAARRRIGRGKNGKFDFGTEGGSRTRTPLLTQRSEQFIPHRLAEGGLVLGLRAPHYFWWARQELNLHDLAITAP